MARGLGDEAIQSLSNIILDRRVVTLLAMTVDSPSRQSRAVERVRLVYASRPAGRSVTISVASLRVALRRLR